jgi:quercetin dioxygenase-like cupin family protein
MAAMVHRFAQILVLFAGPKSPHSPAIGFIGAQVMVNRILAIFASFASLAAISAVTAAPAMAQSTASPVFQHAIPNIPGKSLIAVVVSYTPGAKSSSHHHAGSAFIYAYVLSGAIRSQVDDEPVKVYRTGESWYEDPGAHHKISENASATEPAQLLAVFVVDSSDRPLTVPDKP